MFDIYQIIEFLGIHLYVFNRISMLVYKVYTHTHTHFFYTKIRRYKITPAGKKRIINNN